MKNYIITNDRYDQQPSEVTFEQLTEMCKENDWHSELREGQTTTADRQRGVDCIKDERGEVVAIEKAAYETGDFVA